MGISRTFIDNSALESSAIARYDCLAPGATDAVDQDFLVGIGSGYGYSKVIVAKR